jgi:GT2 family glycosyltransferase
MPTKGESGVCVATNAVACGGLCFWRGIVMIDIAMLSCNRKRITELCIKEIHARTPSFHRLIVMDNGSEDSTADMLLELYSQGLISKLALLNENMGVHFGFNQLLKVVDSTPYYICTDADLIPCSPVDGKDWLARLIELADAHPNFGAISCRPHVFIGGIPNWDESHEVIEVPWAGAALRLMRTEVVRQVGGWENVKRPSRNGEERWISDRLHEAGYKVGYARDLWTIHCFGEESLSEDPWGYPGEMKPQDHGHRKIWPPAHHSSWDRIGIDWKSCRPKTP